MNKKKVVILILILAAAGAAVFGIFRFIKGKKDKAADSGETAYVEQVSNLADTGSLGMNNRYAGTVESQETWSVNKNADAEVKDLNVSVGQEVKKGDVLFTYDTTKYQQDLEQANIDLQRLNNEYTSMGQTIATLTKEKASAKASDQADYTIRIQQQQLSQQQKQLEIQSKQQDIQKLQNNIDNASVKSQLDGVVKSINDGSSVSSSSTDTSYITIIKTGDYRIKGTVNEQNVGSLSEGTPVIVYSRVDSSKTWKGKITKVDTENKVTDSSNYGYSDSSSGSTNYPFYVELENSDGLMLGQHVYMEPDTGSTVDKSKGIWIGSYMVDQSDPKHPFVWAADKSGKLEKRSVTLGETDPATDEVQITDGITMEDSLAIPSSELKEGMTTAPMSEMPSEAVSGSSVYGGSFSSSVISGSYYEDVVSSSTYNETESKNDPALSGQTNTSSTASSEGGVSAGQEETAEDAGTGMTAD
ncbi:MAG: efflux RND transporter periplasmic adaptor subunit [Eubacterium sp.]|nr:efflux RND transporter periplasmic adaptor subunit [Eubacterium sp.]